jgi:hypothetical protein
MLQKLGMHQAPPTATAFDGAKLLKTEADFLELISKHKSELDDVEKRLLGRKYPKKKVSAKDDLYGYGTVTSTKSKKKN